MWIVTLMCVICVGLWVDVDSHPDVCYMWVDVDSHPDVCYMWVDVESHPDVCYMCWIEGRRGKSP